MQSPTGTGGTDSQTISDTGTDIQKKCVFLGGELTRGRKHIDKSVHMSIFFLRRPRAWVQGSSMDTSELRVGSLHWISLLSSSLDLSILSASFS